MSKKTYLVSELDERSRQYLVAVRRTGGQNMAGIYLSAGSPAATWGFPLTGIIIIGVVLYLVVPPLNDPTHQAMLLTAGLLLGGWLILAGIRIMIALSLGTNLGTFIYADPKQIWEVDHSVVKRCSLKNLQSFTVNGTELVLAYPDGMEKVQVPFEIGILEIAVYLDYWLQARGEGNLDQELIDAHAGNARAAAFGEEPDSQPSFSTDIPIPEPDANATRKSRDWPMLLGIIFFAIALYIVVYWVVIVWHDYAVYDWVRTKTPTHWRAYLLDDRNTMFRDAVQKMLRDRYQQKADHLKAEVLAVGEPGFQGSENAMPQLLLALAEAPQSIVTLRIQNTTEGDNLPLNNPVDPVHLQIMAQTDLIDSLYHAIGQDLITLVQPPEDVPALVDIRFKFIRDNNQSRLEWTLAVRKDPEGEPHFNTSWTTNLPVFMNPTDAFHADLRRIRSSLVGDAP